MQNWPLTKWASEHPRLVAWLVLSVGMVALLVIEAQDVGLLPAQWFALIVATVLVAGLCIWIISSEDETDVSAIDDEDSEPDVAKSS